MNDTALLKDEIWNTDQIAEKWLNFNDTINKNLIMLFTFSTSRIVFADVNNLRTNDFLVKLCSFCLKFQPCVSK